MQPLAQQLRRVAVEQLGIHPGAERIGQPPQALADRMFLRQPGILEPAERQAHIVVAESARGLAPAERAH